MINQSLINKIKSKFPLEEAKILLINDHVDPPDYWYGINKTSKIVSTGFCYLACEVYFHLEGGAKNWWFKELHTNKLPYNGSHFYLQNKHTDEIVDITKDQFGDIEIPYSEAKNKGIRFTSKNCKKFTELMNDYIFNFYEHPLDGWVQRKVNEHWHAQWTKLDNESTIHLSLESDGKFYLVIDHSVSGPFDTPEKAIKNVYTKN